MLKIVYNLGVKLLSKKAPCLKQKSKKEPKNEKEKQG